VALLRYKLALEQPLYGVNDQGPHVMQFGRVPGSSWEFVYIDSTGPSPEVLVVM